MLRKTKTSPLEVEDLAPLFRCHNPSSSLFFSPYPSFPVILGSYRSRFPPSGSAPFAPYPPSPDLRVRFGSRRAVSFNFQLNFSR
ncbi:Hypothetical protein NTJ_06890 [Nesidiocoris tenuis]|uniref:Uncharacterized protein n=1 Tax=Nesidiocoris tenuis TaxID=355587 RepID=A0ABN7AT21_9HEMI|nr:Hypothetical protein NTJ_06890 [Nesidiocoris tenuis]